MKTLLLTSVMVMFVQTAWSQENNPGTISSGKITYEEKAILDIKLEGDAAQYAAMIPKERKSEKVLSFSNEATLYEDSKANAEEPPMEGGEGVMVRMVVSGDNRIYTDLKNNRIIEQRDFMNRIFIVERSFPDIKWKITGNQKTILGYQCMEAVSIDTAGVKTVAWFAPAITIKGGPSLFSNLPGMVLEVNINDGAINYLAKSIEPVSQNELKMEKPREGKTVSEEEYRKIVDEKMKEMGIEGGHSTKGGAHVRVIVRN